MPAILVAVIALMSLRARLSCAVLPPPLRARELPWRVHEYRVQAYILNKLPGYHVLASPQFQLKNLAEQLCQDLESSSWGFRHLRRHAARTMTFSVVIMRPVLNVPRNQHPQWTTPGLYPDSESPEHAVFAHGFTTWPTPGGNCIQEQKVLLKIPEERVLYPLGYPCPEGGAAAVFNAGSQLEAVSVLVFFKPTHGEAAALLQILKKQADLIGDLRGADGALRVCAPPEEVMELPVPLTRLAVCLAQQIRVKGLAVVPKRASSASGGSVTQAYGFVSPLGGLVEEEFTIRVRTAAQPKMGSIEFVVIALPGP